MRRFDQPHWNVYQLFAWVMFLDQSLVDNFSDEALKDRQILREVKDEGSPKAVTEFIDPPTAIEYCMLADQRGFDG